MVTKMTIKNQITIPKKILERAGLSDLKVEEKYFDVEAKENIILLKPVTVIIEERISDKQWQKFEEHSTTIQKGDKVFDSKDKATEFLKKKIKRK